MAGGKGGLNVDVDNSSWSTVIVGPRCKCALELNSALETKQHHKVNLRYEPSMRLLLPVQALRNRSPLPRHWRIPLAPH
jgi:hypothetical protein